MNKTIGFCLTGSFCTFSKAVPQVKKLVEAGYNVIVIMSFNAFENDTRFGKAEDFIEEFEKITGNKVLHTLPQVEPIGPKKLLDLLVILPCSGNTLGKLANGIYDTPVTLSAKSHLRNERPILIGVSTNDALSTSAKNIGILLNYKHYYFIPMSQDDYVNKPFSIVAHFDDTLEAVKAALEERQIQPIIKIKNT